MAGISFLKKNQLNAYRFEYSIIHTPKAIKNRKDDLDSNNHSRTDDHKISLEVKLENIILGIHGEYILENAVDDDDNDKESIEYILAFSYVIPEYKLDMGLNVILSYESGGESNQIQGHMDAAFISVIFFNHQ